jgi:hypothetical protein
LLLIVSLFAKKLVEKWWFAKPMGDVPSVLTVPTKVAVRGGGVTSAADLKLTYDPPL